MKAIRKSDLSEQLVIRLSPDMRKRRSWLRRLSGAVKSVDPHIHRGRDQEPRRVVAVRA